ncbi:MAG TPA: Fe-S oxidoreductase, partial [Ruminococcaceae bacterium]|nr:Fe-S oxidoreductase [Oscillospiraceae bacterium]
EKESAVIDDALRELNAIPTVPCTGCRYCMDCPAGVDIPAVFAAYNYRASHHTTAQVRKKYEEIPAGARADACVSCRACCNKCPQSIDIPAELARVKEEIYAK